MQEEVKLEEEDVPQEGFPVEDDIPAEPAETPPAAPWAPDGSSPAPRPGRSGGLLGRLSRRGRGRG